MLGFLKRYGLTFAILAIVGVLGVSIIADTAKAGGGGFAQASVQKIVVPVQQVEAAYQVKQFAVPIQKVYLQPVQQVQQVYQVQAVQKIQLQAIQQANVGCATQSLGVSKARQSQRSGPLFSRSRTSIR